VYALGIHLGSLTTQAVYIDSLGDSGRLTDLEEGRSYPIPSWVALDGFGSLTGYAALRLRSSESPPALIRFAREALLVDKATLANADQPRTADEIGVLLLNKVLRDLPSLRRDDLFVALTVPDGMSDQRRQQMHEIWRGVGLQNLAFLEDSVAVLNAANNRAALSGNTFLSLVFDEDALKISLLRRQASEFTVSAHTVIEAVSLLAIRNALAEAVTRDAKLLTSGHDVVEPAELEDCWYRHGDAFIGHCADAPQTAFSRELILRYGNRYLTLIFTPAALDESLDAQRRMLESRLLEFAQRHAGPSIDQAICTGKLGRLLNASGLLQKTLGLRPDAITIQPDTALAHGAALYAARIDNNTRAAGK